MVSNHDSRSPFFSLLSLNYSKAIISSSFHYQIVGAKTGNSYSLHLRQARLSSTPHKRQRWEFRYVGFGHKFTDF